MIDESKLNGIFCFIRNELLGVILDFQYSVSIPKSISVVKRNRRISLQPPSKYADWFVVMHLDNFIYEEDCLKEKSHP